jgi:hypothetical protein
VLDPGERSDDRPFRELSRAGEQCDVTRCALENDVELLVGDAPFEERGRRGDEDEIDVVFRSESMC